MEQEITKYEKRINFFLGMIFGLVLMFGAYVIVAFVV